MKATRIGGLAFMSFLPSLGFAQGLTDRSVHAPPSLTLPAASGSYIDPVFGTKVLRVTDASDGTLCVHAYAYWPAFNMDDTRLFVSCDGVPLLYRFDPATDTLTPDGPLRGADGVAIDFEGAYWSKSDPNVLFALQGTKLWRIDVSMRGMAGYSLVHDFAGLFSYPFVLRQLHVSLDHVFTFHSRSPSNVKLDAVVYDSMTNETFVYDRQGWEIDETKIDKHARYVVIDGSEANPGFQFWRFRDGADAAEEFRSGDINAKVGGHFDMGVNLMVNSDGWETGLLVRSYDALRGVDNLHNIIQYTYPNGSLNWTIADHVSHRTDAETFVVGSTYSGDGTYAAFEDEIYLAYTDGSGFVRLAHSRSKQANANPDVQYYSFPRAVVDRLGRYIVFTSDLGSSTRTDVMIVKVPEAYWPPQSDPMDPPDDPDSPDGNDQDGMSTSGCVAAPGVARGPGGLLVVAIALLLAVCRRRRVSPSP